jgi:hypothetical protein
MFSFVVLVVNISLFCNKDERISNAEEMNDQDTLESKVHSALIENTNYIAHLTDTLI